jgi:hypothetical protein
LAALEAHDSDLRVAEDPVNDQRRYKTGKTIRIAKAPTQS